MLRHTIKKIQQALVAFTSILLFSACNGSVSNDQQAIVNLDIETKVNQAVELVLYYPNTSITDIQWSQTSGPITTFLADTSKVIAFTTLNPGDYQFDVSFNVDGEPHQLNHLLTVLDEVNFINARLGHAALELSNVSLKAEISSEISADTVSWEQLSGPDVTFTEDDLSNSLTRYFKAPNVDEDTLLTFRVKGIANGNDVSDTVTILVEDAETINSNAYFDQRLATTFPYNNKSLYAQNIVSCVYSNQLTSSCTLKKLPLIADQSLTPTIDDVMSRVVVSHQWMGDKFREFLVLNDDNNDFKQLLRATTAIVISYDVRPSFYWAATGAIYLDPNTLWLSPDERDTINEAPDYRASFGRELQFLMPWRYVKDNSYANINISDDLRVTRNATDGLFRLASLLYHELAHANDFFPKTEWFIHDKNLRILDAALNSNFESDDLAIAFPLTGNEMYSLAQVSFSGETATAIQKSYLPIDIKDFFNQKVANDYYNYSSPREDYAMLFEEFMMQSRYGVLRDTAVTNLPRGENISIQDYIVTWGQRGRIGEVNIKPRVEFVTNRILPEFDSSTAIANILSPIDMTAGNDWLENLFISAIAPSNKRTVSSISSKERVKGLYQEVSKQRMYYHKDLPAN